MVIALGTEFSYKGQIFSYLITGNMVQIHKGSIELELGFRYGEPKGELQRHVQWLIDSSQDNEEVLIDDDE